MFFIPIISNMIIHGNFFPDPICQKTNCILMPALAICNHHTSILFIIIPVFDLYYFLSCAVIHLPIPNRLITVVYLKLLFIKIHQQINFQNVRHCNYRFRYQKSLLQFIQILFCPCIMSTDNADCRVNSISSICNFW